MSSDLLFFELGFVHPLQISTMQCDIYAVTIPDKLFDVGNSSGLIF